MTTKRRISLTVNGKPLEGDAEPRTSLADFLRDDLALIGTHLGCEHGVCGACTIIMDGQAVRSCLTLAVQAEGADLMTVEGLLDENHQLHPIQEAFIEEHGLQCGFCTPGFLMSTFELLKNNPTPSDDEIKEALGGNLCRCTGYQSILKSVRLAAQKLQSASSAS
ncbi:MAG: (2Fe-2S)-binding protein [Deltaproteobacteria bacterium]|nr:(2Fe-2S)-binding protein [Deltaproteobacteria bacterium]